MNIANNIEHWMLIDGFHNYEISSFGRVRNNETNRILKGQQCKQYRAIKLFNDGKGRILYIHRLVAFSFCEKQDNYNVVDHIDRNPLNNHYKNLRWVNMSLNSKNKKTQVDNTSGHKGISYNKRDDVWQVSWYVDLKKKQKAFKDKDEAITFRLEMEKLNNYL